MPVTPKNCDTSVKKAIQQLQKELSHVSIFSLTASRLLATDANQKLSAVTDLTSWIAGTANQLVITDDGDGTLTGSLPQDIATTSDVQFGSLTLNNTGLHLLDTNASHDLILAPGSDLTADRTLTLTTGDSNRTLTLSGNPTLNDWFDQSVKTTASPTLAGLTLTGQLDSQNIYPATDDTYYLGKNDDDTPYAWKGLILKDQAGTGKYYRLEISGDALQITDLTD
jgi:hypothetical protein